MRTMVPVLTVGLLGVLSPVHAQPTSPPTLPVVEEQLVVTATLLPEAAERLPGVVDRIDADEIDRRSSGDAVDLLRTVPGVVAVQLGSPGKQSSLFVRGAGSGQTLVLWNGIELNDPAFGGFDWALLGTDGLDRIEIVRGPYSAVWGSSAMGGVVQLVTRRTGGDSARLRVEAGSDALRRAEGDGRLQRRRYSADLAAHLRRGDGVLPNDFYDGDEISLRLEGEPTSGSRLGLLVRRNETEVGLPYDYAGLPSPGRHQPFDSTAVGVPFGWNGAGDRSGGRWQLEGALAWIESAIALEDGNDPFAASATDAERRTGRAVLRRTFESGGWIAGGGEIEREEATSSSAFGPGLTHDSRDDRALFVQAALRRGRLAAEIGIRRDDDEAFGGATSLRGGLVWSVNEIWRLRTSYGESFRAPSLGDLYFPGFSNPALEPERGESLEAGLEADAGSARFGAALFQNDFEQLIEFDFVTFAPANVGSARVRGFEAWAGWRRGALDLRTAVTWMESENRATGEPLVRRPEWSGHALASWAGERLTAHAAWRHVGARSDVGGVELPSHSVSELGLGFAWTRQLEPYFRVDNLFDLDYEEAAGFPAPGRSWAFGLRLRTVR